MVKEPLISVIVPVFNGAEHILTCLDSISRQTYRNFEVCVIDDGSTDDTLSMCKNWVLSDKRFCVFHQENKGPSAARNFGIENSQGEYLYFADSDDWLEPDFLRQMIACSLSTGSQVVFTQYNLISGNTGEYVYNGRNIPYPLESSISNTETLKLLLPDILPSFAWSFIAKRNLFFFPERINFPDYNLREDQAILYKLVSRSPKIGFVHQKLYNYVVNDNSLLGLRSESFEMFDSCVRLADERQEYMDSNRPDLHILTTNTNMQLYFTAYRILERKKSSFRDLNYHEKMIRNRILNCRNEIGFIGLNRRNKVIFLLTVFHLVSMWNKISDCFHWRRYSR